MKHVHSAHEGTTETIDLKNFKKWIKEHDIQK